MDSNKNYLTHAVHVIAGTAANRWYKADLYASAPYFTHPMMVSMMLHSNTDEAIVGMLHDHIEDHRFQYRARHDLRSFPAFVLPAVELLTRSPALTYFEYIQSIIDSGNWLAKRAKVADLLINIETCNTYAGPGSHGLRGRYEKAMDMFLAHRPELIIELGDAPTLVKLFGL